MMTTIWSGLSVGALYAIGAVILTIPLVRCGVFNFAQMHYIVLGTYLASVLMPDLGTLMVFLILIAGGVLLGSAQEILTVRPVHGRTESVLVTTLGMAIAIEGFIIGVWGTDPRSLPDFLPGDGTLTILGGKLAPVDLFLIGIALAAGVILQLCVTQTRWGLLGRAAMTDQVAGMLRGLNIPRLRTAAFALAGALSLGVAPIAGAKIGVSLEGSLELLIFTFAAAAVGGFGSFAGALIGGFAIGLVDALCARYLGVDYAAIVVFGVLASVLLVRPTGLVGIRRVRLV